MLAGLHVNRDYSLRMKSRGEGFLLCTARSRYRRLFRVCFRVCSPVCACVRVCAPVCARVRSCSCACARSLDRSLVRARVCVCVRARLPYCVPLHQPEVYQPTLGTRTFTRCKPSEEDPQRPPARATSHPPHAGVVQVTFQRRSYLPTDPARSPISGGDTVPLCLATHVPHRAGSETATTQLQPKEQSYDRPRDMRLTCFPRHGSSRPKCACRCTVGPYPCYRVAGVHVRSTLRARQPYTQWPATWP